jgi:putative two-component system response regulator
MTAPAAGVVEAPAGHSAPGVAKGVVAGAVAAKPLILIVDDNPANLLLLGELLDGIYAVRFAKSGAQALRLAAMEPRPSLILLDVMMPEMDGYTVLERLRADPRVADVPVIFVTAKDSFEDEERGLRSGAVDYVAKPINPVVLMARVATHLELKRNRDTLAAQNAGLEAEVARRVRHMQVVQEVSVRALASLGETRDNETGHHIRRTQLYIQVLGDHLRTHARFAGQLTPKRLALIVAAAPLHDIGKIGIRDDILRKPGKLTAAEFEVMKTHASMGGAAIDRAMRDVAVDHSDELAEALAAGQGEPGAGPLDFLLVAQEIAVGHHEKWDGSGYPLGLKGDAIPVSARLMALADVFDALISRRIYKAPMPLDEVKRTIVEGRGRHFDPDAVDAFLACEGEFTAIARRLADPDEAVT